MPESHDQQQQQKQQQQHSSSNGITNSTTKAAAAKLNGLKNRQRPPPLILDKVSNFYNNNGEKPAASSLIRSTALGEQKPIGATNGRIVLDNNSSNESSIYNNQNENNDINQTSTQNSANHKFWASLNQNAASSQRNRSTTFNNRNQEQQQQQQQPIDDNHNSTEQSQAPTKENLTKNQLESQQSLLADNLGQDLIISHRNSSSSSIALQLAQKQRKQSIDSISKNNATTNTNSNQTSTYSNSEAALVEDLCLRHHHPLGAERLTTTNENDEQQEQDQEEEQQQQHQQQQQQQEDEQSNEISNRTDMSNNSELDDSSTHGGPPSCSEQLGINSNGGGNLIGVDNPPTPPAIVNVLNNQPLPPPPSLLPPLQTTIITDYQQYNHHLQHPPLRMPFVEEPPNSATSSRPRSNNPFLAMDEELSSSLSVTTTNNRSCSSRSSSANINQNNNNCSNSISFHKRPASFIAATDSSLISQSQQLQPSASASAFDQQTFLELASHTQQHQHHHHEQQQQQQHQQALQEQFNSMHLDNRTHPYHYNSPHLNRPQLRRALQFDTSPYRQQSFEHETLVPEQPQDSSQDQRDGSIYKSASSQSMQQQQQSFYGVYCHAGHQNYVDYQPTISVDSESAVCKPPPSATLQLPHWTDAIYELNNAILEATSVIGGAENGEFIYIVESGDIILELDQIKVSGFTLVEFKELLESKPVHLLSAVQTKHSHGLTTDIKHYLSCSFPKNSIDKNLQDLIRENIYRRTIPCTTRPPKEGELDKVDYHFLTKEHFIEMNNMGMLLECGMFGGHYYGTMKPFSDLNSLSIYSSIGQKELSEDMRQPLNANHPAIGLTARKETPSSIVPINQGENPLYENQESLRLHQMHLIDNYNTQAIDKEQNDLHNLQQRLHHQNPNTPSLDQRNPHIDNLSLRSSMDLKLQPLQPNIVAVDSESLPPGWERVIDQTHGTYYIDHNTQRTQYERPYEIELTKGTMGFGFTLVETDNGVLLVRSIIPGGPAHLDGTIRPGDILISAVGVSVANLQHTDIARLFSTFAIGDRIRLTFARSTFIVDTNIIPDEYLFSNGTNGDMAVAVNPNYYNHTMMRPIIPAKPFNQFIPEPTYNDTYHNNYYANNEEIALQRVQYGTYNDGVPLATNDPVVNQIPSMDSPYGLTNTQQIESQDELDKYEYHQVDLDRDSRESNWGIRLIGGSEVDRAISIGSIVFGGAASKNGKLKSGDEIISINGYNVVGATHQHVVDLISSCANRASLVVRRRKFAEACEVVLTRNMDEGFGFVIISSHNCALIGSVIEGSPADRCQQLHVKDRIIAVNGNYITSDMQHPEIVNLIKECGSTLRLRIIPADCYTVELIKSSQQENFGFSMRGGSEYDGTPLYILRVAPKGLARDLLNVGDQIIEINNIPTVGMTHQQAATIIKYSDPIVKLKLRRNYVIPPSLLVASPKELSRFNQVTAEMKTTFSMDM